MVLVNPDNLLAGTDLDHKSPASSFGYMTLAYLMQRGWNRTMPQTWFQFVQAIPGPLCDPRGAAPQSPVSRSVAYAALVLACLLLVVVEFMYC